MLKIRLYLYCIRLIFHLEHVYTYIWNIFNVLKHINVIQIRSRILTFWCLSQKRKIIHTKPCPYYRNLQTKICKIPDTAISAAFCQINWNSACEYLLTGHFNALVTLPLTLFLKLIVKMEAYTQWLNGTSVRLLYICCNVMQEVCM